MADFGQIPNPGQSPDGNIRPQQDGNAPVSPNRGIQIHIGATQPGEASSDPSQRPSFAPPSPPPQQAPAPQPPQAQPPVQASPPPQGPPMAKTDKDQDKPWKTLPRDQCAYRSDGKCIGPDECLRKCDSWAQLRATTKFQFSERYGAPKSPKEAHVFFLARKLSQMEEDDDKKLDLWVQKCRECAFHKTLDNWDDDDLHKDGDGQTGWSSLI